MIQELQVLNDAIPDPAVVDALNKDKARAAALLSSLNLNGVSSVSRGRTIYI